MPFDRLSKKGLPFPVVADDPVATQELAELVEVSDAYIMEQWGADIVLTGGLTYAYKGGTVFTGGAYSQIADGTVTLAASDVNYVERDAAGSVTVNQTAFSVDKLPMAKVTTDVTGITDLADWRVLETPSAATVGSHVVATTTALGPSHSVSALASGMVLRATGATTSAYGYLVASDIPSLGASKITAGSFGTGAYVFDSTVAMGALTATTGMFTGGVVTVADIGAPGFLKLRSANGTEGSPTATLVNDLLGSLHYIGHDGGGYDIGAIIRVEARENWTATNHGCEIQFFTTGLGGQSTPVSRWRIEPQGSLMTTSENVDIGSAGSGRVRDLFTVRHVVIGGDFTVVGTTTFNTVTYTWPATDGTAGYVLSTNSSGILTWIAAGGDVTSVSGTANRITCSPTTGAVVVDIHASYVGQTTITTLGTVTAGTWQGASITTTYTAAKVVSVTGGTGIDSSGGENPDITLDVSELGLGGALIASDHLVAANAGVSNRQVISSIPLSIFDNNLGWTANAGTVTSVGGGTGITSTGGSSPSLSTDASQTHVTGLGTITTGTWQGNVIGTSYTSAQVITIVGGTGVDATGGDNPILSFDASELPVGGTLVAGDWLVAANASVSNRQLISSIPLSIFSNNLGWTSNAGTVTSVGGGSGINSSGGTAPSISVDTTVVRTTGNQSISGIKTFTTTMSAVAINMGTNTLTGGRVKSTIGTPSNKHDPQHTLFDSSAMAAGVGGFTNWGGKYTSGGAYTEWAAIGGIKENATSGQYGGHLVFYTRPNGTAMIERMRITAAGVLNILGTIDHDGGAMGLYGVAPIARQQVIGSRSSGTALTNLLIKLALTGIIINGTSA